MTKKIISFSLALALILVSLSALADGSPAPGNGDGNAQSPTLSMTLNNLNQVTGAMTMPPQSPTLSMTLNNLNQVSGAVTSPSMSPTLSATLTGMNQITGAAGIPSPTLSIALNSPKQFTAIVGEYGVPLDGLFTIMDSLTDDAQAEFNAIASYVGEGNTASDYFEIDVPQLILKGELSANYAGVDASSLILSEYVSLGIHNDPATDVDVAANFGFASEYADGQTVVVMFGYHDKNGAIVWNALNTVAINGQIKIDFPSSLLEKAGSEAILGILS